VIVAEFQDARDLLHGARLGDRQGVPPVEFAMIDEIGLDIDGFRQDAIGSEYLTESVFDVVGHVRAPGSLCLSD
jgi:hypothetical protein